jgi:putative ABC transport system substrate-binding protein
MRRREFITLLGGAAAWPLAARAQQPGKLPVIGFLAAGTPSSHGLLVVGFERRLRDLGWTEGRNIVIEVRWAEGRGERYAEIAAEFVRLKVDVIVTGGSAVLAAKQVTAIIPIVFATRRTLSVSVTSQAWQDRAPTSPACRNSALILLANASNSCARLSPVFAGWRSCPTSAIPAPCWRWASFGPSPRGGGIEVVTLEIRRAEDIGPAFDALKGRADALYICSDPLVNANRVRINTLALAGRLPTMHGFREYVDAGGLMSYGPNFLDLYRRAAELVDKILRGAKPADLPVEQPTKFDLVINLTTAKALGLEMPPMLLARADEVIE